MATNRKRDRKHGDSAATTKLRRLLETEQELEVMLSEARRAAEALVETARLAAEERKQLLESELEAEHQRLRERIARERDEAISSIREGAEKETTRLDGLDDAKVAELAHHVVGLLVGQTDSRGSR